MNAETEILNCYTCGWTGRRPDCVHDWEGKAGCPKCWDRNQKGIFRQVRQIPNTAPPPVNLADVECPACDWKGHPAAAYQTTKDGPVCPNCIDEGGYSRCVPVTALPSEDKTPVYCPDCAWTGELREAQTLDTPLKGRINVCPDCMSNAEVLPEAVSQTPVPTGIEALVCADIAARQQMGIKKYGRQLSESPDDLLVHAYEEATDLACYLRGLIEQRKVADEADTAEARLMKSIFAPETK